MNPRQAVIDTALELKARGVDLPLSVVHRLANAAQDAHERAQATLAEVAVNESAAIAARRKP